MLVSVLINNYNYEDFIVQCVDSVLNQTYKDIEIIVYDDGSTDHSLEKLSQYSDIKVISKANHGKSNNLNQMNAVYQAYLHSKGSTYSFWIVTTGLKVTRLNILLIFLRAILSWKSFSMRWRK